MKTNTPRPEQTKPDAPAPVPVTRMEIASRDLLPDGDNRTIDEGDEEFQTLTDSVRVLGVLVALQVQRRPDGKFQIWDGERRWRAAKLAGLPTVPCDVWPESTQARDMVLAGVVINEQRQPHSCLAVARRLRTVKNQFAETHEQIATRTGLPAARVKAYLNLFNASDRLFAFFDEESIALKTAVELVRFEKSHGEVATRRLLERHRVEPLAAREIEDLRKKREVRSKDDGGGSEPARSGRLPTLASRIEAAFRRDARAAWLELETVAAKLGFRIIGEKLSLPVTQSASRGAASPGASPGASGGEPG